MLITCVIVIIVSLLSRSVLVRCFYETFWCTHLFFYQCLINLICDFFSIFRIFKYCRAPWRRCWYWTDLNNRYLVTLNYLLIQFIYYYLLIIIIYLYILQFYNSTICDIIQVSTRDGFFGTTRIQTIEIGTAGSYQTARMAETPEFTTAVGQMDTQPMPSFSPPNPPSSCSSPTPICVSTSEACMSEASTFSGTVKIHRLQMRLVASSHTQMSG